MLILNKKIGEKIEVVTSDGIITIQWIKLKSNRKKFIGITAPKEIKINFK